MEVSRDEALRTALINLGLSQNEIAAYKTSLDLGSTAASSIAKAAGLNRSHTYTVLTSLIEKGLVEESRSGPKKMFRPVSLETLLTLLERQAGEVQSLKERLEVALPHLPQIKVPKHGATVSTHLGDSGIFLAWEEMSGDPEEELIGFIDCSQSLFLGPMMRLPWRRVYEKKSTESQISIRLLISGAERYLPLEELAEIEIPQLDFRRVAQVGFGSDILVAGDKVALISQIPQKKALIIESPMFAQGYRALHQLVWNSI